MQDRPNATELVAAVQHFLETEILPLHDDQRIKFRTRVAINALAILQRELHAGSSLSDEEAGRLLRVLDTAPSSHEHQNDTDAETLRRELSQRIRAGDADHGPWRDVVLSSTLESVRAKLAISNPKFLDHPVARYP